MKNLNLLPTDKPSILGRFIDTNNLFLRVSNDIPRGENVNIYITSDEEITGFENDVWVYNNGRVWFWQNTMALRSNNKPKKIILTTDQNLIKDGVQKIDDEFLVWFIENSNCEEINIETIMECDNCGREHCNNLQCRGYKDSPYYKIIIPKEELNYNVKRVKKNNLKNTQFEYELQAMIYEVLKENNNSSIELQSSKLVECVTDYFNHIECTFIIKNGDKTNVKKGKLV